MHAILLSFYSCGRAGGGSGDGGGGGVFNETVKGTKPVTPLDRDYNVVNETKVRKLGGYAKRVRMESVTRDCP